MMVAFYSNRAIRYLCMSLIEHSDIGGMCFNASSHDAETVLHLKCVHVLLSGLVVAVLKVYMKSYVAVLFHMYLHTVKLSVTFHFIVRRWWVWTGYWWLWSMIWDHITVNVTLDTLEKTFHHLVLVSIIITVFVVWGEKA